MLISRLLFAISFPLLTLPVIAYAQPANFVEFSELLLRFLRGITNILFTFSVLGFLYGVVVYLANSGNPQRREEIKPYLFWGVVGITVMFGVWGFVQLLYWSLGGGTIGLPFISTPTR